MATEQELKAYAAASAQRNGVPVEMFLWQIGKESGWNPNAKNPKSTATGLGQFIKDTAAYFQIDPTDPYQSLDAAAKYDAMLYAQTGSWEKALTSYGTLHNADAATMNAFNQALQETGTTEPSTLSNIMGEVNAGLRRLWEGSAFGMAQDTYYNLTGQEGKVSGRWDFSKLLIGNGAFILLGIVVIALAILSNKTVQGVATKAVLKR